jgi:heptosyltransferase I
MLMNTEKIRIAIVRLSALGDIVNTAVALQIIHKYYPNAIIDWYVEEAFAPILENHPLIHEVIAVPIKRIKKTKSFQLLRQSIRNLRSRPEYDQIIDVQGLVKSAIVTSFIRGKVHGFDRSSVREKFAACFYDTTSAIPYEENVIKRNVQVITEALKIEYDEKDIIAKTPLFLHQEKPDVLQNGKNIACVIGASWPSKCYPKEQFAVLCSELSYPCYLIWGSETERADAEWIEAHASNAKVAPKMSLPELIAFIAHCDLTIGNDTGPTHMAWAMNRASITLFGPTNERMIFPTDINVGIKSPSEVNILKINRNDFSIKDIHPSMVIQKAKELLV